VTKMTTTEKLTKGQRTKLRKAAEIILNGFIWASTNAKSGYWDKVHTSLEELAEFEVKKVHPDALAKLRAKQYRIATRIAELEANLD